MCTHTPPTHTYKTTSGYRRGGGRECTGNILLLRLRIVDCYLQPVEHIG